MKNIGWILIVATLQVGCSTIWNDERGLVRDSSLSNLNPAPELMAPNVSENPDNPTLDPVYMRSQADYHFTLGEAFSLEGKSQKATEEFKLTLVYDPNSALVRLRLAAEYVRQGLMSEAIEQAEMAISQDPNNSDARLLLGGLYSTIKTYEPALAQYREVAKRDPNNMEAPMLIGAILAEQKKYDESVEQLLKVASRPGNPNPHQAYYYIGRVRGEQHKYADAEKNYLKAMSLKPEHVESALALYDLMRKMDREAEAIKMLSSYQEKFGPNKEVAKELGQYFLEKENYDKAEEHLQVVESFERDNLNVKMKIALILIEKKEYSRAAARLEDILLVAPESDKIRFYLGAVYEELGRTRPAIKNYKLVPAESQYFTEAMIHAAHLHRQSGDLEEAQKVMEAAIQVKNDVPQFYAFLASLLDDQKRYDQAVPMLEGAIKKFPEHVQLNFFMASLYDRVGKIDKTVFQLRKVLELDADHVQAMNYLAYTLADQNDSLVEAEELARKAMSKQPNDGYIMDTMGWVLFKKGEVEESVRLLEAAYKVQSSEPIIAEHLGDAYYRLQLMEKARKMYQKAVEKETDAQKAQKLRSKIVSIDQQIFIRSKEERKPASARPSP